MFFDVREVSLTVEAALLYPVWDHQVEPFRALDWKARLGTLAVKGDTSRIHANSYAHFGKPPVKITRENVDDILPMVGAFLARRLKEQGVKQAVLVALPSSDKIGVNQASRPATLAHAIAKASKHQLTVNSTMTFDEVMVKSRLGGPRRKEELLPHLRLPKTPPPPTEHVLVDDVCTSGGHLFAAQELLRQRGISVTRALVGGRTVKGPEDIMIAPAAEQRVDHWF